MPITRVQLGYIGMYRTLPFLWMDFAVKLQVDDYGPDVAFEKKVFGSIARMLKCEAEPMTTQEPFLHGAGRRAHICQIYT